MTDTPRPPLERCLAYVGGGVEGAGCRCAQAASPEGPVLAYVESCLWLDMAMPGHVILGPGGEKAAVVLFEECIRT